MGKAYQVLIDIILPSQNNNNHSINQSEKNHLRNLVHALNY